VRNLAAPLLPEFIGILGIDIFLVLSILTCLFDFPVFLQYVYHISAFVGFGQLWINYIFAFSEETRFFVCLAYLVIGLANIIFINGYVGSREKKILWTTSFLCCVTIPFVLISFSAVSVYVNRIAISLPPLPLIPLEAIAAILVVCAIILATSLFLSSFGLKFSGPSIPKKRKEKEVKNK
jgi:hypothetical protein